MAAAFNITTYLNNVYVNVSGAAKNDVMTGDVDALKTPLAVAEALDVCDKLLAVYAKLLREPEMIKVVHGYVANNPLYPFSGLASLSVMAWTGLVRKRVHLLRQMNILMMLAMFELQPLDAPVVEQPIANNMDEMVNAAMHVIQEQEADAQVVDEKDCDEKDCEDTDDDKDMSEKMPSEPLPTTSSSSTVAAAAESSSSSSSSSSVMNGKNTCSNCQEKGHNMRTCPQRQSRKRHVRFSVTSPRQHSQDF
jgi:hypothetical protein